MWTNPYQYLYNPFGYPITTPFYYCPVQQDQINQINTLESFKNQDSGASSIVQNFCRETVQEIEQKEVKCVRPLRKRRVQKTRCNLKKEKEDNFERKKQKKDRNLPSNICKYFISYLYHHPCPQTLLISTKNIQSFKILIADLKRHIKDNQTYVRPGLLENLCRGSILPPSSSSLLRILFHNFVIFEFKGIISTQKKLTKKQKVAYFKLSRKFVNKFTRLT